MRKKLLEDYEAESHWEGECLVHPSKNDTDASRISRRVYQMRHGSITISSLFVCHTCDNPWCIRDAHHFLGTPKENSADMTQKGRSTKGVPLTYEHRMKVSSKKKGTHLTAEHRAKIGVSGRGKKHTEETRARMSYAAQHRTPENRANISAAAKLGWIKRRARQQAEEK